MYDIIKEVFSKKFALWTITLKDDELFLGNQQMIFTGEWQVTWLMSEDTRGVYLEYYARNGKRGHLHGRIYENGEEENLEVLKEYIAYSPNVPGDRERSTKDFETYNRRVMTELKLKGLI